MHIPTGDLVDDVTYQRLREDPGFVADDWVAFEATPRQAERLVRRVALGNAELERRQARRKQQKASRRANR